jgi:hypothetical protein
MHLVANAAHQITTSSSRLGHALGQRHKEDQPFLWLMFLVLTQYVWLGIHVCSFHFWLELVDLSVPLYAAVMMMMP